MRVRPSILNFIAAAAAGTLIVTMGGRMVRPAIAQQVQAAPSGSSQEPSDQRGQLLLMETQEEADQKSAGCKSCHTKTDSRTMHSYHNRSDLGCTDCHGGDAKVHAPGQASPQSAEYIAAKNKAHPQPHVLSNKLDGALPVRAYTSWLREDSDLYPLRESQGTFGSRRIPAGVPAAISPRCRRSAPA